MNKYIIIYFLIISSFALSLQSVFSASGEIDIKIERPKTIRELQESADSLKKEQLQLEFKWTTFQIGNETLGDFIISLNQSQFNTLSEIITLYQDEKNQLEVYLKDENLSIEEQRQGEKNILLLKKDFYTNLIPYIKREKLEAYKTYISNDVNFNEKSKIVIRDIEQIEGQKKERIEEIQEKIEDNNRDLRKSLAKKLRLSVNEKLDAFVGSDKFGSLSNENKILVFTSLRDRISIFKENFEKNTQNTTSFVLDEKVILLELVEEIIESYIDAWK